jgi:tRNA (Thr-GGU) A37 N-methylase
LASITWSALPDGWGKAIEAREKFSPLAACWTSELGGLNKFVHTWVYKDLNERARVREESRKPGGQWPPQTGVRPIRQENKPHSIGFSGGKFQPFTDWLSMIPALGSRCLP